MATQENDRVPQRQSPPHASRTPLAPTTPMRLVVAESSSIPRHQRVAILDGLPAVSIGRDSASRLRLKERSVSKIHASVSWDTGWAITDLGSACGTLVNGERLSRQRQASAPRALRHTDRITIGSTTLVVHIHRDCLPCINCALVAHSVNELPLRVVRTVPAPPTPPPSVPRRKKQHAETVPAPVSYPVGGSSASSMSLKLPEKRRTAHASSSDSAPAGTTSSSTDDHLASAGTTVLRPAHRAKSDGVTSKRRMVLRPANPPVRRPISEPSDLRSLVQHFSEGLPRCGSSPDVNGILVAAVASQ